nr:phage baseplate assembly protein V [uncultured Chitinophaga sp.]
MVFKYGVISEVKPGYAKVYFEEDDIATDWWPVVRRTSLKDKESWPLNVQEHVACLCNTHCEDGVVIGAIHNTVDVVDQDAGPDKFRIAFEDGTTIEYDKGSHKLTAIVKGSVDITATQDISATSLTSISATATVAAEVKAPSITLTGNVTITGTLTAAGGITTQSDIQAAGNIIGTDVRAGAISLTTHKHSGVRSGTDSSGPPSP